MAAIKGKDTKPEMIVRKYLWANGFRYRLNHPRLPGKPDIVLRRYRTCVFVNGCFWHGHNVDMSVFENTECCKIPHTNRPFWVEKIQRNKQRDEKVQQQLAAMGWHSITVWKCELSTRRYSDTQTIRQRTLQSLAHTLTTIYLQDHTLAPHHIYTITDDLYTTLAAEE